MQILEYPISVVTWEENSDEIGGICWLQWFGIEWLLHFFGLEFWIVTLSVLKTVKLPGLSTRIKWTPKAFSLTSRYLHCCTSIEALQEGGETNHKLYFIFFIILLILCRVAGAWCLSQESQAQCVPILWHTLSLWAIWKLHSAYNTSLKYDGKLE